MSDNISSHLILQHRDAISSILVESKSPSCSIVVRSPARREFATFDCADDRGPRCITIADDHRLYVGASTFKPFIALSVVLAVEKLAEDPNHSQYACLREAWQRPATEVFKAVGGPIIPALRGDPTLLGLIQHISELEGWDQVIIGPDATYFASESTIHKMCYRIAESPKSEPLGAKYSNLNYILLALFIESVSKMKLFAFMKKYIFDPLGMCHTFATAEEASSGGRRMYPYVVSDDGSRGIFREEVQFSDTAKLATLGGYISAGDLGRYFENWCEILDGRTSINPYLDLSVYAVLSAINGGFCRVGDGYTGLGLLTTLNHNLIGSHSLNRLIPLAQKRKAVGNKRQKVVKECSVYYVAGSATGWAATIFFVPTRQTYVICLVNSSGPLDPSDTIASLCLYISLGCSAVPRFRNKKQAVPNFWAKYFVGLSRKINRENSSIFEEFRKADSITDQVSSEAFELRGIYLDKSTSQYLEVFRTQDRRLQARIWIKDGLQSARPLRLVWTNNKLRMCSRDGPHPRAIDTWLFFGIDVWGAWRSLELIPTVINGQVVSLSREGKGNPAHVYERQH